MNLISKVAYVSLLDLKKGIQPASSKNPPSMSCPGYKKTISRIKGKKKCLMILRELSSPKTREGACKEEGCRVVQP